MSLLKELGQASRLRRLPPQARRIVFYAEGRKDYPFFKDLIAELLKQPGLSLSYISSEASDPLLDRPPEHLHSFYLNKLLPWFLMTLEAKALVMTVPDLNRYQLRRSIKGANHVYLFHALCSTHMIYRFGAFDHYDTIFCAGPHQVEEIRKAEELYNLPAKKLVETGYPLLDRLERNHRQRDWQRQGKPTVLVAPSWAPGNLLESCAQPLAESLSQAGFRTILRPHPELLKRNPEQANRLKRTFSSIPGVELELDPAAEDSFHEAQALVTDWSGIGMEYAFATERPVLFINTPKKINNPRFAELGLEPLEVRLRSVIGKEITAGSAPAEAAQALRELLGQASSYQQQIRAAREGAVFNPGRSAALAARFLLDLTQ